MCYDAMKSHAPGYLSVAIFWGCGKTIGELHALLIEYEKGKGKGKGKGKDKSVYIPKPKNPIPSAKEHPTKDDACHHCKEVGHCKRNCHAYLAELIKKKKQVGTASSSVSKNDVLYLNAIPRDGIYEIVICLILCQNVNSIYKDSYFITFMDDYSRYGYVYLLKHKHEIFETFKVFKNEVENQLGKTIKALRSDRGGEYISQEFKDYLKACGIIQQLTPPYTAQHNGVFERRNHTLLDMVRSMMNLTTLPLSFWDYALESATGILNMVPTKKVDKTPYELWYGKVPNLSYLKVWGCEALVKRDTPDKLQQRSFKYIFIGYPKETMGYYFYFLPENKIVVARYAEFLEKNLISQEVRVRAVGLEEIKDEDTSPFENTSEITMEVEGFEPPQEEVILVCRSARTRQAPERLCLNIEVEEHSLGDLNEPTNYKAAMLDLESNKWLDAMNAKMQSMKDNQVWCLVDLPPNARLVAKVFYQTYGVDYEEAFSSVADIRAIRILIAISTFYDYEIWQMDVKTVFLNGYLDEDIYMVQPKGFVDPKHPRKFGFAQNIDEPCVYQKASGSNVTFLILYVDDIIIMGNHIPSLQSVNSYLGKCFTMKDSGEAAFILGIKIYQDRTKRLIGLSQSAYMDKILKMFKMENSKRGKIPMQERFDLNKTKGVSTPEEVKRMQNVPYASAVGSSSETRPPMLEKGMYNSWKTRIILYIRVKENGEMLKDSIENGPYKFKSEITAKDTDGVTDIRRAQRLEDLARDDKLRYDSTEMTKQERESMLLDEFDKFTYEPGESIHSYYLRFAKLINDMNMILMSMTPMQINPKFVNHLQPEWSRFVTAAKQARNLHSVTFDQLYSFLKHNGRDAKEVREMRQRFPEPLDLLEIPTTHLLHTVSPPLQSYAPTVVQQPPTFQPDTGLFIPTFLPTDDPIASLNKAMIFSSSMYRSKFPPTNNQLQTSSNPRTQATIQNGQVTVQNVQGHMAKQCTARKRVEDSKWFKDKMILAQAKEAGVVLDEEQQDFLADSLEETDDSTTNAIFMANLSPVGSLNDGMVAPRYDSDTLSEVPHYDTYHDSDMFNSNIQELGYIENIISNNESYDELKDNSDVISYTNYMLTIRNDEDNYVPPPIQKNDMMLSVIEQMKSQVEKCNMVLRNLNNVRELLTKFDECNKRRTTLSSHEIGSWKQSDIKVAFKADVIPLSENLKETFKLFEKGFITKVKEMKDVFEQMEDEVD
ncbi:retrovirus-related pol polyprotein from transposon TNT 1-94 [Tanacetum coccineum]|uniref:Retrovirus-related pol polyprotein from transposon TNT 1-94 n=1 Tax=Tanacetum coccineum TaxID=301880 RepID=A0ABQ5FB09_9ASTR